MPVPLWSNAIQEYLVFAVVAFILSIYLSVEYYSVRTIVLDTANDHYSVYRGAMLTATQHCHNIFIRLLSKSTGTGKNMCTATESTDTRVSCLFYLMGMDPVNHGTNPVVFSLLFVDKVWVKI